MSRSKHHQQPIAHQWNPPPLCGDAQSVRQLPSSVASATECTGLEQRPVLSHREAEAYTQLYGIHSQKPQGNIGKGNPNNDPSEIAFHRS